MWAWREKPSKVAVPTAKFGRKFTSNLPSCLELSRMPCLSWRKLRVGVGVDVRGEVRLKVKCVWFDVASARQGIALLWWSCK